MRVPVAPLASVFALIAPIAAQQIYDIWATTWDRGSLFTYTNLSPNPINFASPGAIGDADIVITDTSTYQSVWGFGASLTDSSALILNNLKSANSASYWKLLNYLFDPTDGANAAGFSYLRIPLGASDFSASVYSFDDRPSYLFSVLNDIRSINSVLRIHILPWSPPGWMKDSGTMRAGTFFLNMNPPALQGFKNKGISVYAISIQNEPENSDSTYPTCKISAAQEAAIGTTLRSLMNSNGFSSTKIVGYDHNWNDAGGYPIQLMQDAPDAFSGVSFHCYSGSVSQQDTFHSAYPQKEIYFTECSGVQGSDWWSDIKWYMDNLFIGSIEHSSHSGLMWNLALDGNGSPMLPGTGSCGTPCRPLSPSTECHLPRDSGGPWGKRIGVSVGGTLSWGLRVGAYVTGRVNSSDWLRYSLVTTIEFRGVQATYTFPVGVTTLWWYAPNQGNSFGEDEDAAWVGNSTIAFEDVEQMPLGAEEGRQRFFRFNRPQ
ncbi:glycoside hydrolase [Epithele typhae]|uniref:glycoside hydrolase n=1 Tax=Epithele typhae TaxID=378194 RepID=UPI002007ACB3|nr:glycoside hydrolase [Epithele typhae]KAH9922871.1 glycoside hydrolase [Epithele typhae]